MPRKRHILSGAIYETESPGVALVTTPEGTTGRFDSHGIWIDGELREADPHMCLWVAGQQLPAGQAKSFKDLPLAATEEKKEGTSS